MDGIARTRPFGQRVCFDDLSRALFVTGSLETPVHGIAIGGVTSNSATYGAHGNRVGRFSARRVAESREQVPMRGAAQREKIAPSDALVAPDDPFSMSGHVLCPAGDAVVYG